MSLFQASNKSLEDICLERLCEHLETKKPNFDRIAELYKKHPNFNSEKSFQFHEYFRAFKDIYLKLGIIDIASQNPDLKMSGIRFPKNNRYQFSFDALNKNLKSLGRVNIREIKKGKVNKDPKYIYENLISVHGRPTIIESYINGFKKIDMRKRKIIQYFYNPYKNKSEHKKPSYIILAPKEICISSNTRIFKNEQGMIAYAQFTREEFRHNLELSLKKHNLLYTKENDSPTIVSQLFIPINA